MFVHVTVRYTALEIHKFLLAAAYNLAIAVEDPYWCVVKYLEHFFFVLHFTL